MNLADASVRTKIRTMKWTLLLSFLLMSVKFYAYFLTHSVAILTDAMESIINVLAGGFALYCIIFASHPKDKQHPYGHGKIESLSAGFEGALIFLAGVSMIVKGALSIAHPPAIVALDEGIFLTAVAGAVNYLAGRHLVRKGEALHSDLMIADGKHLITDMVSSVGLIAGLAVIVLTKLMWLDGVMAVIFGALILRTGYLLIKESANTLLDKADEAKLHTLAKILSEARRDLWVDVHSLRVLKYGSHLHVDCHVTLPWYESLESMHGEIKAIEKIVRDRLQDEVEFFIHSDPCDPRISCPICPLSTCVHRKSPFVKRLEWTLENMLPDGKHQL